MNDWQSNEEYIYAMSPTMYFTPRGASLSPTHHHTTPSPRLVPLTSSASLFLPPLLLCHQQELDHNDLDMVWHGPSTQNLELCFIKPILVRNFTIKWRKQKKKKHQVTWSYKKIIIVRRQDNYEWWFNAPRTASTVQCKFRGQVPHHGYKYTLKAFEIVDSMRSRTNPPARVPTIPQTIVIPPNIKSALLWK